MTTLAQQPQKNNNGSWWSPIVVEKMGWMQIHAMVLMCVWAFLTSTIILSAGRHCPASDLNQLGGVHRNAYLTLEMGSCFFPTPCKAVYLWWLRPAVVSKGGTLPLVLRPTINLWVQWVTIVSFASLMVMAVVIILSKDTTEGWWWMAGIYCYYFFPSLIGDKAILYLLETYINAV